MRRPTTSLLVTMALAVTAVVFVAGSAAAAPPKKTTTTNKTKTTKTTTTKTTTSPTSTTGSASSLDPNAQANANGPGSHYSVINGTANAASDHVIMGTTAFPNFTTGAVDNYYSMAHTHVDNSPFAEGTASPLDTGPVGQTAAAGNFQQPQYADARWPGDDKSGKASYGTKGQPYAVAGAGEYNATAEASVASNGLSGPSAPGGSNAPIVLPKGFDGKLRQALAGWKAKWQGRVLPKPSAPVQVPVPVPVTVPSPSGSKITTPTAPAPPPIPGVTTPTTPIGGLNNTPPPSLTVPTPPVPRTASRGTTTTTPSRSMQSASSSSSSSAPASADGESLLESSTSSALDPKTDALVTTGESRLGRVSLGDGQIVIEGIHVSATITNDGKGTPSYKVGVTVASATIGGVPVTIDQDGVHLATQSQALPYKQASDSLNAALKQAGIQLFLVGPEINTNSCNGATGGGGGASTTTTTTSNDGTTASSNSCAPAAGMGSSSPTGSSSCDQTSTGSSTTTTTSSTPSVTTPSPGPGTTTSKTTTTTGGQTSTTSTTSSCGETGMGGSSSCTTGTTPSKTSPNNSQTGTTSTKPTTSTTSTNPAFPTPGSTSGSGDQTSPSSAGGTSTGEMTIIATGLHLVFVQPAGAPSGVPAQNTEHILGEVYLDSLAVPGVPFTAGNFNLFGSSPSSTPSGSSSSSSSSCLGGVAGGSKSSGGVAGGLSSAGGSNAAGSLGSSGSGSGFGSSSQSGTGSSAGPLGASLAHLASWARHKPKWLLLSYLVWQALAIAAAASLWKWQGEGAS